MKIQIYKNALPVSYVDIFLSHLSLDKDSVLCIKVDPTPGESKFINEFLPKKARTYSFMGLRGAFFIRSKESISLDELASIIIGSDIKISLNQLSKNWYISYADKVPFLMFKKEKHITYYVYTICFPGAPCKPYNDKPGRHPSYRFTMEWSHFDERCDFYNDHVLVDALSEIKRYLSEKYTLDSVYDVDNVIYWYPTFIEKYLFKNRFVQHASSFLNEERSFNIPEKYSIVLDRHSWLYMYADEPQSRGLISLHKHSGFQLMKKIFMRHRNRLTFIYADKAFALSSPDDCHTFAKYIMDCLPSNVGCTSYCQIAFNEKCPVPENTDLAYGHNVFAESLCIGAIQIFFYDGGQVIRLSVYNHNVGMFLLCGPNKNPLLDVIEKVILNYEK